MKHSLHTTTLKNGSAILFVNAPGSSSYYFNTITNAGFNYIDAAKHELPHLLEHLAFEGSKNYPKEGQMGYELECLGGWYNAATSDKNIRYYLVGSMNDYIKVTELALEQYTKPLFRQRNIDEQKKVVERELKRQIDDDGGKVRALTMTRLFPDKLFYPRERIHTLKNITKADIESYYQMTHTQANTFFVVAGDLTENKRKNILELIDKELSSLPIGKRLLKKPKLNLNNFSSIETLPSKLKEQMYFSLAFVKPDYNDAINFRAACTVASAIYNRGDGSRIFRKARSAGLAYGVNSGIYNSDEYSELYIIDRTDPHLAHKLFKLCINELVDIKNGNFTDEELSRAKGYMAGENDTEYETSRELADWYGPMFVDQEELYSPEQYAKAIRVVSKKNVVDALKRFVKNDNWLISLVGHDTKSYENKFVTSINNLRI